MDKWTGGHGGGCLVKISRGTSYLSPPQKGRTTRLPLLHTWAEPVKKNSRMRNKCELNHTSDRQTNTDKQTRTETHKLLTRAEPRVLIFQNLESKAFVSTQAATRYRSFV